MLIQPITSPIDKFLNPIKSFIKKDYSVGVVLMVSVVAALIWANGSYADSYEHLWHTEIGLKLGDFSFYQPLHIWINDALMAIFFFVIGLELKREFMAGELSSFRKAMLPMGAALGGMIVPALIYVAFNAGRPSASGWGIPMATDIAFALALLTLAGKHLPGTLKIFLSALAVADDLGAVLVIALFYTAEISWMSLGMGALLLIGMVVMNMIGIRRAYLYGLVGVVAWLFFFYSGVHATIAGVLAGFTIPARTKIDEEGYVNNLKVLTGKFEQEIPLEGPLTTPAQHKIIEQVKEISSAAETPLQKLEHSLHHWVMFLIMPLFALSNAGLHLSASFFEGGINGVMLGIFFGLLFGKIIGITGFTFLMVKTKLADLPEQANFKHVFGVSILAAVGFTMSLFISNLAFTDAHLIESAKYAILITSLLAGVLGILYLKSLKQKPV